MQQCGKRSDLRGAERCAAELTSRAGIEGAGCVLIFAKGADIHPNALAAETRGSNAACGIHDRCDRDQARNGSVLPGEVRAVKGWVIGGLTWVLALIPARGDDTDAATGGLFERSPNQARGHRATDAEVDGFDFGLRDRVTNSKRGARGVTPSEAITDLDG